MNWIHETIQRKQAERYLVDELKETLEDHGIELSGEDVTTFVNSPLMALDPDTELGRALEEWRERVGPEPFDTVDSYRVTFRAMAEYRLGYELMF
mgnify:CR=1 FL=1